MSRDVKRTYLGGFRTSRVYLAFNPVWHHDLSDQKLGFNDVASRAELPTAETLAVVTQRQCKFDLPVLRPQTN